MAEKADLTPKWDQQDRADLRKFLSAHPNLLPVLAHERPKLARGAGAAEKQVLGLEIAQHFETIELIRELASDAPTRLDQLES